MSPSQEIEKLASQILYHKKLYYSGKSILSDKEYDILEVKLKSLSPTHPALSVVGYKILDNTTKISHEIPMLSLAKTYSQSDLLQFLNKYRCIATEKFDGMALSLEYDNSGNLTVASTRGNGKFGENITEHVYHILSIPKKIKVEESWPKNIHYEIRGEIYFPLSKFTQFEEKFDSFRNAVPGTMGRKDPESATDVLNCFEFYPYDLIVFNEQKEILSTSEFNRIFKIEFDYIKKIQLINFMGFHFNYNPIHEIDTDINEKDLEQLLEKIYAIKKDYHIDGIVFRIRDEKTWESLGNTAHHPRGSLAFKQAGETALTEILSIEQNIGRSGKISFRAKLKPVFLSGATISYATLHNAEYIEQGNYSEGAKVEIIRSGEVIPAIVNLIEPGPNKYLLPKNCLCGYELTRQGPDLMCLEKRSCNYKDQESLVYFVSSLDIMGVSDKIIFKMREAGLLKEPADLYKITAEDLIQIEGFAQKSSENIVNSIQNTKQIPLAKFLTALGLKRGGEVKCQEVAKKYVSLKNVLQVKTEDLIAEKGWAEKSAEDFVSSLQEKYPIINNLLKYVQVLDDKSADSILKYAHHPYYGKNICITGSLSQPREEYKFRLEKIGAKVVSSVSSKTDFLVCNEASSSSSKYKDAQKLGVPIITEAELTAVL